MNGIADEMLGEIPVYHHPDAVPQGATPGILLIQHHATTLHARKECAHTLLAALAARCYKLDSISTIHEPGIAPHLAGIEYRPSISYSRNWIALACWPGRHVGIDLCSTEAWPDQNTVASLYFSPDEHQRLLAMPPAERALLFAQTWAELEARTKCLEQGLLEWSPERQALLDCCIVKALSAPAGHVLYLAG